MTLRLLIVASALAASAGPALAGPGSCVGQAADDAAGQSVLVRLRTGEGGRVESREAEWSLSAPGRNAAQGLSLKLGYVEQVPEGMGPVTSVTLSFLSMSDPRALSGATGALETARDRRWSAPFQGFMGMGMAQLSVKTPWGGRLRPELAESIERQSRVAISIRRRDGSVLDSAVVDAFAHAVRDRLFLEAKAAAERRAAAPEPCS